MHTEYRDKGFEILAFPCNQFMNQEPGSNEEVKAFAQNLYKAEFPLFAKIEVNGPNAHDVYRYCRINSELYDAKKKEVKEIPWNFAKFLINEQGKVISYHNPRVEPVTMIEEIEKHLGMRA